MLKYTSKTTLETKRKLVEHKEIFYSNLYSFWIDLLIKIHHTSQCPRFELPLTHFPSSNYALRWYHVPLTKGGTNSEVADLVKMKRLQVVMSPTSGKSDKLC